MGETVRAGEYSIVLGADNPTGTDVGTLLARADSKTVIDGVHDVDGAVEAGFEENGA